MKNSKSAFTLIEVMAALAILSIGLVVLIKSQTISISNVHRVANFERAVYITENQLHWTYLDLHEAESWREYAELSGEDGDFAWRVAISLIENESAGGAELDMLKIVATTQWLEGAREKEFELTTYYLWAETQ